jgi:hypothetical protein
MDAKMLATKLAVIHAVEGAVKDAKATTKAALENHLDAGDRMYARHDGEEVGTISRSKSSATARVTDRAAFTAWCADAYPGEVRVTLTLDADVLLAAFNSLRVEKPTQEEDVAFARVLGLIRSTPADVNSALEARILADVVKAKTPVDPHTGEVIPGVEYVKGGEPGSITARVSDDQKQAILDAYQAGTLDLLTLAITDPAELEAAR